MCLFLSWKKRAEGKVRCVTLAGWRRCCPSPRHCALNTAGPLQLQAPAAGEVAGGADVEVSESIQTVQAPLLWGE